MSGMNILYGGEFSYFTGKARAYLRWKGVPFEERLATKKVYQEIIVPRIGYPMVPLLITPDDIAIQDTTEIIDHFEANTRSPSVFPETPQQLFAAYLFELYGDEWLIIPAMHYRWAFNKEFALQEFGKVIAPDQPLEAQHIAAEKASAMFQAAVPMLGATPEMAPAIEASYLALLEELNAHFEQHDYLFGTRPSIGDFGLIGPLYAHQYRDPASGEIMKAHAPAVAAWVERMQSPPAPQSGDFLPDDEIPETLLPVLKRMMSEQAPCLIDLVHQLTAWKKDNPAEDIPRVIGMHNFTIESSSAQRLMLPYTQWMLQRVLTCYEKFDDSQKQQITSFAKKIDAEALLALDIKTPVQRKNHQLVGMN